MENTLCSVLQYISDKYPELLYDRQMLVSAFGDFAPNMRREKKIIQAFVLCDGVDTLCKAKNSHVSIEELNSVIDTLVDRMDKEEGISSSYAYEVCNAYTMCIGLKLREVSISQERFDNNYEFTKLKEGTIGIKKYIGKSKEAIIPDSLQGLRVTKVLEGAFRENDAIVKVTIPNTVIAIDKYAFYNCTALETVKLPSTIATIGENAFYGCSNLVDIPLPSHLFTIGRLAFYKCKSIRSIVFPGCLTSLGNNAFSSCSSLTEICIPGNIKSLGNSVFAKCSNLKKVTIEDGILTIGMYAFSHCDSLKEISLPSTLTTIIESAFNHCKSLNTISLPDSIKEIGRNAFWQCFNLQRVNLPSSIESIGYGAFHDCRKDIIIIVDKGSFAESYCKKNAIQYCYSKKEDLNISVKGLSVFDDHTSPHLHKEEDDDEWKNAIDQLSEEDLLEVGQELLNGTNGTKKNPKQAFNCFLRAAKMGNISAMKQVAACYSVGIGVTRNPDRCKIWLEKANDLDKQHDVIVPIVQQEKKVAQTKTTNESNSQYENDYEYVTLEDGTLGIKKYIGKSLIATIPGFLHDLRVTRIMSGAFKENDKIVKVSIPNTVTSIGEYAFFNCTSLETVLIPDSVNCIEGHAFSWCKSLIRISIPNGISSINDSTFYECYKLQFFSIPKGVKEIGDWAFKQCAVKGELTIPDNVEVIGKGAFSHCHDLENIILPQKLHTIGWSAFGNCYKLKKVILPEKTRWFDSSFDNCSSLKKIIVHEQNNSLRSIDGILFNSDGTTILQYPAGIEAECYTVPTSVRIIGKGAFSGNRHLHKVVVSSGVKTIEASAFDHCTALTDVFLPNSLTRIEWDAFSFCTSLCCITIPESITEISSNTFSGCRSLTDVCFSSKTKNINDMAFWGCRNLSKIVIPNGTQSLGRLCFGGCERLTHIELPLSISTIGEKAFDECASLVIYGRKNTFVEKYAIDNNYTFVEPLSEKKKREEKEEYDRRKSEGRCQYCGGKFNIFRKCKLCGLSKDY